VLGASRTNGSLRFWRKPTAASTAAGRAGTKASLPWAILAFCLLLAALPADASPAEPAAPETAAPTTAAKPDSESSEAATVDSQVLEDAGARIGEIVIRARPIFDTESGEEDNRLFRLANHLHRKTRDGTIRRRLLFGPGDTYSRSLLEESERALRHSGYLYDAQIGILRYEDNVVDVFVDTRDV